MCDLLTRRYTGRGGCGHCVAYDYQRCQLALRRPNKQICIPPTGNTRDLPRVLDVADDNIEGRCPRCKGETPPSSRDSEVLEILW